MRIFRILRSGHFAPALLLIAAGGTNVYSQEQVFTPAAEQFFAAESMPAAIGTQHDAAPLTLTQIEQFALANNPSLSSAQATSSKAAGLLNQVGTRPNPTAGYFGMQIADEGTDQHGLYVEQEFVRGKKLQLNREVLRHTVNAQRWEAEVQRNRVLTDLRVRFFEAAAAQLQLDAIAEFSQVASRGVDVAAARLKAQEASRVELLQAKIMYNTVQLSQQQTDAVYRGAWKDLAAVAGLPATEPLRLATALTTPAAVPDWEQTYADLLTQSPELAVANALVCEKRAHLKRQKAQPTPNLMAQFGAGYDRATDSGLINLQFAAPLPISNRNSGNVSAAYADYVRAVENVNRIKLAIRSRLARVAQAFEASFAAVQKYQQEILPQAKESLDLSQEAYEAGELDFLQVLVVRRRYFDSNLDFIQAQSELAQAEAKIEGLLLTGGLDAPQDHTSGDGLRGQSFGGQ
jgi:cobalt-zinc-cadmium efflux system outer membrane protein